MGVGTIYGGTNAIYITGDDSDVLKYVDCKDLFDFCQTCGSGSSSTTFLIAVSFIFSFVTLCLTWASICYKSNELRRGVGAGLTCLTSIIAYANFEKCYQAISKSDGVKGSVEYSRGYDSLLYGFILCLVIGVCTGVVIFLEEKTSYCTKRSGEVYATNEEFEFEDVEANDPDFAPNLD